MMVLVPSGMLAGSMSAPARRCTVGELRESPNYAWPIRRVADHVDFNRAMPYQFVRASGTRGDCFAHEYRLGAQYLLLLQDTPRPNVLYWWALGPANEQLHGNDDPWLAWVRERVRRASRE
jgi:hypothetical protein